MNYNKINKLYGNLKGYPHPFSSNECVRVVKFTITTGLDSGNLMRNHLVRKLQRGLTVFCCKHNRFSIDSLTLKSIATLYHRKTKS